MRCNLFWDLKGFEFGPAIYLLRHLTMNVVEKALKILTQISFPTLTHLPSFQIILDLLSKKILFFTSRVVKVREYRRPKSKIFQVPKFKKKYFFGSNDVSGPDNAKSAEKMDDKFFRI